MSSTSLKRTPVVRTTPPTWLSRSMTSTRKPSAAATPAKLNPAKLAPITVTSYGTADNEDSMDMAFLSPGLVVSKAIATASSPSVALIILPLYCSSQKRHAHCIRWAFANRTMYDTAVCWLLYVSSRRGVIHHILV